MKIAIYCELTGLIQRITECPEQFVEMQCSDDESYVILDNDLDDSAHYVDLASGAVQPKKTRDYNLACRGLSAIITGLPAGTLVRVEGAEVIADNDPTTVTFDVPGEYLLELVGPAECLDETLEVVIDG